DRRGAQRGQVGARLGLGVADREVALARQDARQEPVLLLGRPVLHDRRRDGLEGDERVRDAGAGDLVGEDLLLDRAETGAAVLLRPAQAELAVAAEAAAVRHVRLAERVLGDLRALLGGQAGGEVLTQLVAEPGLFRGQVDEHQASAPIRSSWASAPPSWCARCLAWAKIGRASCRK